MKSIFLILFLTGFFFRLSAQSIPPLKSAASVSVSPAASHHEFVVYPNPSNGRELFINLTGFKAENLLVVVTDLYGNELFSKIEVFEEGGILYSFDPSCTLKPGMYQVIATANDDIYRQRIIVR